MEGRYHHCASLDVHLEEPHGMRANDHGGGP